MHCTLRKHSRRGCKKRSLNNGFFSAFMRSPWLSAWQPTGLDPSLDVVFQLVLEAQGSVAALS
jgi:hypothetical protein